MEVDLRDSSQDSAAASLPQSNTSNTEQKPCSDMGMKYSAHYIIARVHDDGKLLGMDFWCSQGHICII